MLTQEEFDSRTAQSRATFSAKVLADSVAPNGCRLTTMEVTYPRIIHSEWLTHRKFSRNSASSRAIPMGAMLKRIEDNPFFPLHWGKSQKGMQAEEELTTEQKLEAGKVWLNAATEAIGHARILQTIGIHKQIGNRVTEPWMWITVIYSATNWENMFALRCHKKAEPHYQYIAYLVRGAYDASTPRQLQWGDWHLPLFDMSPEDAQIATELRPRISAGRCARVSYLTHMGLRDPEEDLRLYRTLAEDEPMHASPLEHPAQAVQSSVLHAKIGEEHLIPQDWGNFDPGWLQFRKTHKNECVRARAH